MRQSVRSKEWLEEGEMDYCNQYFFLSNFMVAKYLFWFEYEMSVLWEILLSDDGDD